MTQFVKVGRIVKDRRALKIEIDGREACGEQIIGAAAVRSQASGSPGSGEAREIRISSPSICMVTLSSSANGNAESPATPAGMLTNRVRAGPCARILPSPILPIQSILHGKVFIDIRCSM